ncbi:hypothetical protein N7495_002388 [Penicillium taxi]|uniref:uncharacterized protein n=1 Tax=Penicillium taxi TaxID=168475 RepID=UPI0025458745|nr:uncharacterized protein N7495_002388 [Penicillium taxi]KAJ5901860.1 hypothetical protein N7495_002388 [Penicillium taxi]
MDSTPTRPVSQLIAGIESPSTAQLIAGIQSPSATSNNFGRSTLRRSLRPIQHQAPTHDVETEELRVQVNTLRYELENIKQERDLEALRHEKETREFQLKSDADFRKAQAAESSSHRANHKYESLAKELKESQDEALNGKVELERKVRSLQDEKLILQEEFDDVQAQMSDQDRHLKYQINELETMRASLQKTIEEVQVELLAARNSQQSTQDKLCEREAEFETLEAENIRLRAEGNDAEALTVLKRHVSEQVHHIRELEVKSRDQASELRHLRQVQKNVEVVEEEKRSLENQLQLMNGLESENNTLRIQKQMLEDERQSWASLLQDNAADFDSPEDVVKGLVEGRIETATLVDRIGTLEAQSLEQNETIKVLEKEKAQLVQELEQLRTSGNSSAAAVSTADVRAKSRLERQRVLAVKEVEYLRAQLKTFDEEEETMNAEVGQFDQKKSQQISELQNIVDEYRSEVNSLHEELSRREAPPSAESQSRGTKRPLSPTDSKADNERLAVLTRKNRKLQDAYTKSEQSKTLARKELEAAKSQLKALKARSSTRVLELKGNPTAEAEKIKMTTLRALKAENRDLLAQLRGNTTEVSLVKKVPASALESLKLEMQEMERVVADKEKRNTRLREIYAAKAIEFREAVASLLGYKLDILPNGRVRVTSMFHLSPEYRHGDPNASSDSSGPGSMGNGEESSILFDGQSGSMKLSGGNNSMFAMEIRPLLKFWVQERKDIPCFLAAMTLDFYDKTTRAARV